MNTLFRWKRQAPSPPNPPSGLEMVSVTEDSAQLSWDPPEASDVQINYRIEIKPENSQKTFSMMTEETRISFEELRPNTLYKVSVFSYRPSDGQASVTSMDIKFTTKTEVYRLPTVINPKADSTDFATLKVSWEIPHIERSDRAETQIGYYRIMLLNLAANSTESRRWTSYRVPGGSRVTSFSIADLQPDSFYRVRIIAVSATGADGNPATIASSPRLLSRPPSAPPTKVTLSAVGALRAAFTWLPPPVKDRNGEIVAYQLEFNSPEWLAPRELTVADGLNYTLTGLNPRTNYSLTVAAATRAGIGPKSQPLTFTTTLKSTPIDNEVPVGPVDSGFDNSHFFVDSGVATLPPLKVHNLRYVARERNILLLWSIPPISASPHRFKGVVVHWGNIYPGPNKAEVGLDKRAFSIESLEPSTTYMISVALMTEDGEGPVEMITAQTKPVSHAKDSLIPLNFRLLSAGSDWAIMAWDAPTCSSLGDEFEGFNRNFGSRRTTQRASPCASGSFSLLYQLRYDTVEFGDSKTANTAFANCPEDGSATAKQIDVNVTWVRLEQLRPSGRYVSCVRAITHDTTKAKRIGDWSFLQIFETQQSENSGPVITENGEKSLKNTNKSSSYSNETLALPDENSNGTSVDGSHSSDLIGNSNSDIWVALAVIMVTTIVLMIIVIVVVCWAKRSPIMVVGYKPDQQNCGTGLTEASVNLLSPSKGHVNGAGENGVNDKIPLQNYPPPPKSSEAQLIDFASKAPEPWTVENESAIKRQQQKQQGLIPMGNPVPMMGIRSAIDPMSGCGSDAASRGATGSSASSAISLLPTTGAKINQTYVSPTGNPLISPTTSVPPYGIYPSAQPQLGTFAQAYYHQHHQNALAGGGVGMYPPPAYMRGGPGQHPPPVPPHPSTIAFPLFTPSNVGGPRIDLSAGENEGTYLQYPGLLINRGHIAPNTPSVNASDLISESSSALEMASATRATIANNVGVNPAEFSTVSTVSSCSNSNSNLSGHQGHHLQRQMQHLQPQTRGAYNSLPARKDVSNRAGESQSTGVDRSDINKAISTEELTQEMANLDGLMKDLSVITQNEFGCLQP